MSKAGETLVTGEDLLRLAATKLGQRYVYGALAPKDRYDYSGPWDCAEFTSFVIYQLTGKLFGCNISDPAKVRQADAYTGFYERDAMAMGKIVSVSDGIRIPGAMLLRKPKNGAVGHVVFSDGRGGTIEAANPRLGVIRTKAGGRIWDYGILVNGIEYHAYKPVPVAAPPLVYRLTTPLMQGPGIAEVQRRLKKWGYKVYREDGLYDPVTHAAVVQFQKNNGLRVDGQVGPETAKAIGIRLA